MDNFTAITFLLGLAIPFGWEAVTEEGWRRYGASALAAAFFLAAIAWIPLKSAAPPLAAAVSSVAAQPGSWFTLFIFTAALIIFTGPQFGKIRLAPPPIAADDDLRVEPVDGLRREIEQTNKTLNEWVKELCNRIESGAAHRNKKDAKFDEAIEKIKQQIAINYPNASTVAEAFHNLDQAVASKITRIIEKNRPFLDRAKGDDLDLLYLLDWARGIETVNVIPLLLEIQPKALPLQPPISDVDRVELQRTMKRWQLEVSSVARYLPDGDSVRRAVQNAQVEAEGEIRRMPPSERPVGVDPIAFQDHFILAHQCAATERSLRAMLEGRRDMTLSTMSELLKRYTDRNKSN